MVVVYALILVIGVCSFSAILIGIEMWIDSVKERKRVSNL